MQAEIEKNQESTDFLESSLLSAGVVKQLLGWERSHADTVASSYDMKGIGMLGHILRIGKIEQLYKVSTLSGWSPIQRRII